MKISQLEKEFESDDEAEHSQHSEDEKNDENNTKVESTEQPPHHDSELTEPQKAPKKKKEYESMAAAFSHVLKKEVKQNVIVRHNTIS